MLYKALFATILVLIIACSFRKEMFGKYSYIGKYKTVKIELDLKQDSTFTYSLESGLQRDFTEGNFNINNDSIILNSYPYQGKDILPVTYKIFSNKVLLIKKDKIEFDTYLLIK